MTNSRAKGAAGEREASKALAAVLGPLAAPRRGQQFSGSPDSPDIVGGLPGFHLECKRVKRVGAMRYMEQSVRDASGTALPAVVMREDRGGWMLMINLSDLPALCASFAATHGRPVYPADLTLTKGAK